MIIPPDPEKDPNVFSPSSSTPSLLPPPSEPSTNFDSTDTDGNSIRAPAAAHTRHTNPAFGYPFVNDDLGIGYAAPSGEQLPPYRRASSILTLQGNENRAEASPRPSGEVFGDGARESGATTPTRNTTTRRSQWARTAPANPTVVIPASAPPIAALPGPDLTPTASSSRLPYTLSDASASKLWEGHSPSSSRSLFPPLTPGWRKWWKRHSKWVYVALGLLLAGIGLMIGLLVGMRAGQDDAADQSASGVPWKDTSGDKRQGWVTSGESLNITYNPARDGPHAEDGNITNCPLFLPFNLSSPSTLLSHPFPATTNLVAEFEYPLWKNGSALQVLPDFTFIARGLGSSGTIEIVGSDAPKEVINSGKEGVMRVEVVLRYSGVQEVEDLVRVCELARGDEGIGLGVFTPQETDGKVSNAYMLNPTSLPSFHIIVYLPPSSTLSPTQSTVSIPNLDFVLDRMAVRFGNLQNVVEFGSLNVTSGRGGVDAVYVSADRVDVRTGENSVRGRWNITESIIVNNTEGSIVAEIILHDSTDTGSTDNATLDSPFSKRRRTLPGDEGTHQARRYYFTNPTTSVTAAKAIPSKNNDNESATSQYDEAVSQNDSPEESIYSENGVTQRRTVSTWFMTAEGILAVAYLHQPTTVSLSGLFINGAGDTSISLHPNYIGPFVLKNTWGQVRVPPPMPVTNLDPTHKGRIRALAFGDIDIPDAGIYVDNGLNETVLQDSAVAFSGAVYWRGANDASAPTRQNGVLTGGTGNNTLTPKEVQRLEEADGEVLVMNSWGDVAMTFDGR